MSGDITNKKASDLTFKEKLILNFYEAMMSLVGALIVIVLIYTFGVKSIAVDGTSMLPTLQHGDRLVITAFCAEPEQGDIIVSTQPNWFKKPVIKRIIATENQTVDIDFTTGDVFVDGVLLDEPYINNSTINSQGVKFPLTVPPNHVFVMGDNRQGSTDSRSDKIGFIREEYIFGVAKLKILNYDKENKEIRFYKPSEWRIE